MPEQTLTFGPFRLDASGQLWRGAEPILLGGRGTQLLELLLARRNEIVTKAELMDAAWPNQAVEESNLSVQVAKLRKLLGADWIRTVERVGYKLVDAGAAEAAPSPPQPATVPIGRGNLSRYVVECVLRENEAGAVGALVRDHRLASIVGPGGVGKTTLALAVANGLEGDFANGVWVVDLATIGAATPIESAVIETIGIAFRPEVTALETVIGQLRDQNVLLVLDNCEHLARAAGTFARALLAGAPRLKMLTTSQVPLGIPEERVFKLSPFAGDGPQSQAAAFVRHCYAAHGEMLDDSEVAAVVDLCRELDGLALPLKLAASQAAVVGFANVEEQLREIGEGANEGGRHGTVRNSMAWSYGLLSAEGQRVFRGLGVFQGSFSLAAAAAVAAVGTGSALTDLVHRSMLVRDSVHRSRYRLLEPFRLFALDLLAAAGEEAGVRQRHAAFIRDLFRNGLDRWETMPDDEWVALHQPDSANLRAALDWAERMADWPLFSALTAASHRYWFQISLPEDELQRCELALASTPDMDSETRAIMIVAANEYEFALSPKLAGMVDMDWAIGALDEPRLREFQIQAMLLRGVTFEFADNSEGGRPFFREANRLVAGIPNSKLKARTLVTHGLSLWAAGDKEVGAGKIDAGLAMHEAFGNASGYAISAIYSAEGFHRDGDTDAAIALTERTLPYLRAHGGSVMRLTQLHNLMSYLLAQGRPEEARTHLAEALAVAPGADHATVIWLMQSVAEMVAPEDATRAALLLGYADGGMTRYAGGRQISEQRQLERILVLLAGGGLAEAEIVRLRAQGAEMSAFEVERLVGGAPQT